MSPTIRRRRSASARRRKPTRSSPRCETRELYDRFGHEGLRTGGFRPTDFDFGSLNDLFSAFFGDDLFGGRGAGTGRRSARGADVLAEVEIELVEAAEGVTRSVPFPVVSDCKTCRGSGAAPGTEPVTCGRCGGAGRLQSVSSSFLGQVVRTQACPECGGAGRGGRDALPRLRRRRPRDRGAGARDRGPAGHPRRSADPSERRRPRRRPRRTRGRSLRLRCTCGPTSASCGKGTTSSPPST